VAFFVVVVAPLRQYEVAKADGALNGIFVPEVRGAVPTARWCLSPTKQVWS
jgi:hypothetical protein